MVSLAQWSSSVQLLQVASLCLHGTYLNYMTDCHSVFCWSVIVTELIQSQCKQAVAFKCMIQLKYVTEAFKWHSQVPSPNSDH